MFLISASQILIPVAVLAGIGFVAGILIAVLSKVFYVEVDTRIEQVIEMLPGYNCGACGHPGCSGLATAIINDGASVDLCKPIKRDQKEVIREFLRKQEELANQ